MSDSIEQRSQRTTKLMEDTLAFDRGFFLKKIINAQITEPGWAAFLEANADDRDEFRKTFEKLEAHRKKLLAARGAIANVPPPQQIVIQFRTLKPDIVDRTLHTALGSYGPPSKDIDFEGVESLGSKQVGNVSTANINKTAAGLHLLSYKDMPFESIEQLKIMFNFAGWAVQIVVKENTPEVLRNPENPYVLSFAPDPNKKVHTVMLFLVPSSAAPGPVTPAEPPKPKGPGILPIVTPGILKDDTIPKVTTEVTDFSKEAANISTEAKHEGFELETPNKYYYEPLNQRLLALEPLLVKLDKQLSEINPPFTPAEKASLHEQIATSQNVIATYATRKGEIVDWRAVEQVLLSTIEVVSVTLYHHYQPIIAELSADTKVGDEATKKKAQQRLDELNKMISEFEHAHREILEAYPALRSKAIAPHISAPTTDLGILELHNHDAVKQGYFEYQAKIRELQTSTGKSASELISTNAEYQAIALTISMLQELLDVRKGFKVEELRNALRQQINFSDETFAQALQTVKNINT